MENRLDLSQAVVAERMARVARGEPPFREEGVCQCGHLECLHGPEGCNAHKALYDTPECNCKTYVYSAEADAEWKRKYGTIEQR